MSSIGFTFISGTSMATGEKVTINVDFIESMQSFILDGEEHCFVNLVSGKQFKLVQTQSELKELIQKSMEEPRNINLHTYQAPLPGMDGWETYYSDIKRLTTAAKKNEAENG